MNIIIKTIPHKEQAYETVGRLFSIAKEDVDNIGVEHGALSQRRSPRETE